MAQKIVAVSQPGDVYPAQIAAREMANQIGFDGGASEQIVLVVTELATNLVRHAGGGNLIMGQVEEHGRIGIEIESRDSGPGILCVDKVFADGYSTAAGPGYGLGTINRLMDDLHISAASNAGDGTIVTCRRWVRELESFTNAFAIGVATRAHPLMPVNGDSFVVKQWEQNALVAVIDGLGHGHEAHRAAETARRYVESHFDSPLSSIFLGVSRECVSTRGVVMAIARLDRSQSKLTFASIGNIEARIFDSSEPARLAITRGILGYTRNAPMVKEHKWDPVSVLVLHSDGLRNRWQWTDFDFADETPSRIAQELMLKLSGKEDDATVVVVKQVN